MKLNHVSILIVVGCTAIFSGCPQPTPPEPDQYVLTVSAPNNKIKYSRGETILFNLRLLRNNSPVPNSALGVYDDLSFLCASIPPTDANGTTSYQTQASRAGAFSFIFLHPTLNVYASYSVHVQEASVNDSFRVLSGNYPTLPLGSDQSMNKQTFSQKSLDVTVGTLRDAATNPIFVGSLSLCLIGVIGTAAVGTGAPLAAFACPAAYNVFMGSLLWNVTNNAVDKFVTDPVQKQKAQGILTAAAVTQSVMAFNDALIQSPKGGKALLSYDYNSYQGTQAGQRAFQRITDVGDAVNTLVSIQDPRIQIINDSAFACSFVLSHPVSNGYPSAMNEERIVTIGVTLKSHISVNLSGTWQGILTQRSGGASSLYNYTLQLLQSGTSVSGSSRIEIPSSTYFAVMNLSGSTSSDTLLFTETQITSQNRPPGYYWLLKSVKLKLSANGDSLNGTWNSNSGEVKLRKATF